MGVVEDVTPDRLSTSTDLPNLVGIRIYLTTPTENCQVPFVTYTASGAEPNLHTQGVSNRTRHTLDIDVWGANVDTVLLGPARLML